MPNESIFEDDELQAEATGADDAAPPQQDGPARGPDGKFVAKEGDPEPQPDPNVNDQGEPGEGDDKPGTVPQGALHAERERRKKVEQELAQAREALAGIQKLREQAAARKPAPLPGADDPAAMEHLRARLGEIEQTQTRFSQQQDMAAADAAEVQQLAAVMQTGEAEFRAATPDYDEAISHVVQARAQELQLYGLNAAQIQATISEEATEIVRAAVAQNRNPAELAYQIAKSRGYRPAAAQQQQQPPQGGAQAQLDAIARAQAANKSLGQGAGSTPQTLNAEAIAKMNDDEFEALYATPEGRKLIDAL